MARDAAEIVTHALEGIGDGFVAVLPEAFFNRTTLARLSATGLLGGVLVLEEDRDSAGGGGGDGDGGSKPNSAAGASTIEEGGVAAGYSSPDVATPQVRHAFVFFSEGYSRVKSKNAILLRRQIPGMRYQ